MSFAKLAGLSLLGAFVLVACQEPASTDEIPLEEATVHEIPPLGVPASIAPGKTHRRELELSSGDFVQVLVDQRGVDVAVRLLGSGGEETASVDSPNGKNGFEELLTLVESPGRYRVEVVSISKEPGEYVLDELVHRPATAEDRDLVDAEQTFQAARKASDEEAVELYERSLAVWTRLGHVRRQIDTQFGLCRAYRSSLDFPLAVAFCEQTLALYRTQEDQRGMDVVLDRAGWLHLRRGQEERAVPYFEEATRRYLARGFDAGAALALRNLGVARHQLGDTRGSLEAFNEALAHVEGDPETESDVRTDYGNVLLDLQRLPKASEQYERVLAIRRELGDEPGVARALQGIALTAARQGELERASAAIAEAIRRAGDRRLSLFDTTSGFVRRLKGDLDGARQDYEEALRRARESGSREGERLALARLGQLDLETHAPAEALRRSDALLDLSSGVPRWEAVAHVHGGRALAELGRLEEAWQRIEAALTLVEGLRGAIDTRPTRTDYFASRQAYYETAIDVLLRLHRRRPGEGYDATAFAVNERRLARELYESFALSRRTTPVLTGVREEEKRVEGMLAEAALLPRDDPQREERIRVLLERLEKLTGEIRRAALGEERPAAPEVAVDELSRGLLDEKTLLVAFVLGEERSYLWTLSSSAGLSFRELAPRAQIEERAQAWTAALGRSSSRGREAVERLGRELSGMVLDGVPLTYPRIVLVLEGALQAVPFAALPDPEDGEPLVRRHELVVVPSASTLLRSRRARKGRVSSSIAILADPVFNEDDERLGGDEPPAAAIDGDLLRAAEYLGMGSWNRLRATRAEAERIRELYGEDALLALDFEASRETLSSGRLRGRAILHFATHAVLADDRPELSGLVLSLFDEKGAPRNGFVRSFEIARLDLGAELVVLSGCRTGIGRDVRGEGMQGLARAFLDAGVARVLFSLWEVADRPTAELMTRFHAALVRHGRPAAALREAQLDMLENGAEPRQWAGFVLLGDWLGFSMKGAENGEE